MRVRFLDTARSELNETIEYYDAQAANLGQDFADEVRQATIRIARFPTAWQVSSQRTRRCLLERFPYALIYAVRDEEILIVAVAHQHRKPGYWKSRLK